MIKEKIYGEVADTLPTLQDAMRSALEWLKIEQGMLKDAQALNEQNYRQELVQMSEARHQITCGDVMAVDELNDLMKYTGIQYEAVK